MISHQNDPLLDDPTDRATTADPSTPPAAGDTLPSASPGDPAVPDVDAALEQMTHAPVGSWAPDVLGEGFTARTVELLPDDDGPVVATVVRYRPEDDPAFDPVRPPHFVALYLHGWNDYFHQSELARQVATMGGAFYALDLRKYGRSLRPGQLRGYVEALSTYDEDIHAARALIREDHPALGDVVLMGHSTGGLTAALWAHRHPGALRGLVLNAPWLDITGSSLLRTLGQPVVERLARYQPRTALPLRELGFYNRTLRGLGAEPEEEDDPLSTLTAEEVDDPALTGWPIEWAWRTSPSAPIRPGWLAAVLAGHSQVAAGLEITCPVLVLSSQTSIFTTRWSQDMRRADTVIDVELTSRRALGLGPVVTIVRLRDAVHDVLLSPAAVRGRAYEEISRWLRAYAAPDA